MVGRGALGVLVLGAAATVAGCATTSPGMPGDPAYRLVEAIGRGSSAADAEKAALDAAIGEASGRLVLGEQRVEDDRLVRDRIDSYSAGYIRDHEVLESWRASDGRYTARVRARVASSSIHHRALPVSKGEGRLPGRQVATEIRTQLAQRERGDRMLTTVLEGYPEQAYTVTIKSIRSAFDSRRNPSLAVSYSLRFSPLYLDALAEVTAAIAAEAKSCGGLDTFVTDMFKEARQFTARSFGAWLARRDPCGERSDLRIHSYRSSGGAHTSSGMFFADDSPIVLINSRMGNGLFLRADFYDEADRKITTACQELGRSVFHLGTTAAFWRPPEYRDKGRDLGPYRPELSAQVAVDGEWNVPVTRDGSGALASVRRMSAKVVAAC